MSAVRTYHAHQATHLSDLVNLKFAERRFGAETPRLLRVREPDGPSTAGGLHARQPIVLVKDEREEVGSIMCGFLDITTRRAELRSYGVVSEAHRSRYEQELDLGRSEYEEMLSELKDFLGHQAFETKISHTPRRPSSTTGARMTVSPVAKKTPRPYFWAVGGAVGGFALCYLLVRLGMLS